MSAAPVRVLRSGSGITRGRARSSAPALALFAALGSACPRAEPPASPSTTAPPSAPASTPRIGSTAPGAPESGPPIRGEGVRGRWLDTAPELAGLSGLTARGEGRLYAVPERDPRVVPLRAHPDGLAADGPAEPILGVPDGMDLESVSLLPDGRLLFGTERLEPFRDADPLLVAARGDGGWVIERRVELPYARWGLSGEPNRGLEGVCAVGPTWLASSETLAERDGRRLTPLARVDTASAAAPRITALWIALSSAEGKISGLECRAAEAGAIELFAVERHYATMRILRLRLPPDAAEGAVLEPERVLDLAEQLPSAPNLEGLALDGDDLLIVADNQGRTVTGPIASLRLVGAARRPPAATPGSPR